jgi:hypothetical protein
MSIAEIDGRVLDGILHRASDPRNYERFLAQGKACGWCRQPVRLRGRLTATDPATGERELVYSSRGEPEGVLLKACGTRRETRCPSCARIYRDDARQIISAGLVGGKGMPPSVVEHPTVFATLTAPSYGSVHASRKNDSVVSACHPGPPDSFCPHGRPVSCWAHHDEHDPALGEPLCAACFDAEGVVVFNACVGELWRRTVIALYRMLAKLAHVPTRQVEKIVRVSFAKVVEYQRRGVVHVHAVIRLDDRQGGGAPPAPFDSGALVLAVRLAALRASMSDPLRDGVLRWGEQLDVRRIGGDASEGPGPRAVANYIAKYSVKSSDPKGALDRRLRSMSDLVGRDGPPHLERLAETAWLLGDRPELAGLRLRLWAHDLGHRGHWTTKSRHWSTTFRFLSEERQRFRLDEARSANPGAVRWRPASVLSSEWAFDGTGWVTPGDAYLAQTARAARAEARQLAREQRAVPGSV